MNRGEEVVVSLIVSCGDCPEVFEFVKEPFDKVSLFVESSTEIWLSDPVWHQSDIAPRPLFGEAFAQSVAVVSTVRQQHLTLAQRTKHIRR